MNDVYYEGIFNHLMDPINHNFQNQLIKLVLGHFTTIRVFHSWYIEKNPLIINPSFAA